MQSENICAMKEVVWRFFRLLLQSRLISPLMTIAKYKTGFCVSVSVGGGLILMMIRATLSHKMTEFVGGKLELPTKSPNL